MENEHNEIHAETDAARAGSTPHIVRWILGISLFAAIALLSVIWITGAATQGESDSAAEVRARVLQEYGGQGGVLASEPEATRAAEPAESPTAEGAAPAEAGN